MTLFMLFINLILFSVAHDTNRDKIWVYKVSHNIINGFNIIFRKMNCLHQFVNALCEKGELRTLVSYPYKDVITQQDLRPAVISILLSKARSVDLTVKNYYDLLYSFHVVNNDLLSG